MGVFFARNNMERALVIFIPLLACLIIVEGRVLERSIFRRDESAQDIPRSNTTKQLEMLRALMRNEGISAFLVPSVDAHQSEYVSDHDNRRSYISGFTGSSGSAIVTLDKAALWTDGRYFLQARMQLDKNWILMKMGQPGTPSQIEWLKEVLNADDVVGADPHIISISTWEKLEESKLGDKEIKIRATSNLIDQIWENRPPASKAKITPLEMKFAGKTWQDKVSDLRKELSKNNATSVILYELDETAWLLNLRGRDIPFNPFFVSYIIVTETEVMLFVDLEKVTDDVKKHLKSEGCSAGAKCVMVKAYNSTMDEVKKLDNVANAKVWLSPYASYGLKMNISEVLSKDSPVALPKAIKNEVEREGMKKAYIKDGVAFVEFLAWMEEEVPKGRSDLTEMSAAEKLEEFKQKQADFVEASFASISGFGANGAIIHYRPQNATNKKITKESTFLMDSGSQLKDGTTDTTRTMHYGTPTNKQKEAYTRVLKGQIHLAMAVFPNNTQGRFLDTIARQQLWENGLNYRHGTGHGIGMYLSVHEGPQRIARGCPMPWEVPIVPYMFQSDEPGYYEDGEFGIRLETVVMSVPADTKYHFDDVEYVTFEVIALVPYEKNLIIIDLMSPREIDWLNDYHKKTLEKIGDELKKQGKNDVYDWLVKKTKPIGQPAPTAAAGAGGTAAPAVFFLLVVSVFAVFF